MKEDFIVLNYLTAHGARGKQCRIAKEELVNALGFKSVRELQKEIQTERQKGALICSGGAPGYWLPGNRAELEQFRNIMKDKAFSILESVKSAENELKQIDGQTEIPLQ